MNASGGSILVVDDNSDVLRLLGIILASAGYTTRLVSSGEDALRIFQTAPADIRLALVDIQMPGMDGPTTVGKLLEIRPGLPCIFMTGESGRYSLPELQALGIEQILWKPFQLNAVLEAIRHGLAS